MSKRAKKKPVLGDIGKLSMFDIFERSKAQARKREADEATMLDAIQARINARKAAPTVVDIDRSTMILDGPGVYIRPTLVAERTSAKMRALLMGSMRAAGWAVNKRGDRLNLYDLRYRAYPEHHAVRVSLEQPSSVNGISNKKRHLLFAQQEASEMLKLI